MLAVAALEVVDLAELLPLHDPAAAPPLAAVGSLASEVVRQGLLFLHWVLGFAGK